MKGVVQDLKSGKLMIQDLPVPSVPAGFVLVKNSFSFLSAGTERTTVETAKASLVNKAVKRPDLVKQVLENLKKEGPGTTYKKVKSRLETRKALGYSSAGVVVKSSALHTVFSEGERVACSGAGYAVHAEYVIVPENLCVKIPEEVDFKEASVVTLGAIAMQGVRRADVRIGEKVCVLGLGVLGILTLDILSAAGADVFGVDVSETAVEFCRNRGYRSELRSNVGLGRMVSGFTAGRGFDTVIIAASSSGSDPAKFAPTVVRKKGRLVVLGNFPLHFDREELYQKEVDIRMSTSYGPGRYDNDYEEKGLKYPYEYVRFCERENIREFIDLIKNKKTDINDLITHTFDIHDAVEAYDLITGKKKEVYRGIVIEYPSADEEPASVVFNTERGEAGEGAGISFIGAGSFAKSSLLPALKKRKAAFKGVATLNPVNSRAVMDKFKFDYSTGDYTDILKDKDTETVFIATRHDLHSVVFLEALEQGKNVFVEKPLCISESELNSIKQFFMQKERLPLFTVGYNRRFSPSIQYMKEKMEGADRIVMNYRVNAGKLPFDHWLLDPQVGGGRIVGEFCHFVDVAVFFLGTISSVKATGFISDNNDCEDLVVTLESSKGIASILYTSEGSSKIHKERIEISGNSETLVNDNFTSVESFTEGKKVKFSSKGFEEEINAFCDAVVSGDVTIPPAEILHVSDLVFEIKRQIYKK